MGVVQSAQHRARDPHRVLNGQHALPNHPSTQRLTLHVLHDERRRLWVEGHIPNLHDVRMVELGQGRGFIPELGQLVRLHELQRHATTERTIVRQPYRAESALPQVLTQSVATQNHLTRLQ